MVFQQAERIVNFKVAYLSAWPANLALRECQRIYDGSQPVAQVRAEPLGGDGSARLVLEPKKLASFTPRFHLAVSAMAGPDDDARRLLFSGADAVVVVASEQEAVALLEKAHASVAELPQPVPIWLVPEGGLSPEGQAQAAALALVAGSGDAAFMAVMDRLVATTARVAPDPISAAELARWPILPWSVGPRAEVPLFDATSSFAYQRPPAASGLQQKAVSSKMIWAVAIVFLAFLLWAVERVYARSRERTAPPVGSLDFPAPLGRKPAPPSTLAVREKRTSRTQMLTTT